MKYINRIQINNEFDIPRYVKEHFVLDNDTAKWIVDKNTKIISIEFLKQDNLQLEDTINNNKMIIHRKVHTTMSLTIPAEIKKYLKCKKYDYIEWHINQNNITINCFKKVEIYELSGLF